MLERLIWIHTSNMFSQSHVQNSCFNTKYTVENKYKRVLNIQIYFFCLLNCSFSHQHFRYRFVAKAFTSALCAWQFLPWSQINYCCSTSHSCTVLQYVELFKEMWQKYFLLSRQLQYLLSIIHYWGYVTPFKIYICI